MNTLLRHFRLILRSKSFIPCYSTKVVIRRKSLLRCVVTQQVIATTKGTPRKNTFTLDRNPRLLIYISSSVLYPPVLTPKLGLFHFITSNFIHSEPFTTSCNPGCYYGFCSAKRGSTGVKAVQSGMFGHPYALAYHALYPQLIDSGCLSSHLYI